MARNPPAGISEAEWAVRCELGACYQLTDLYGMSDLASTHISARVPGPENRFLLNPFGYLSTRSARYHDSEGAAFSLDERERIVSGPWRGKLERDRGQSPGVRFLFPEK